MDKYTHCDEHLEQLLADTYLIEQYENVINDKLPVCFPEWLHYKEGAIQLYLFNLDEMNEMMPAYNNIISKLKNDTDRGK